MDGWVSPRLGIRFDLSEWDALQIFRPDGQRFLSFSELEQRATQAEQRATTAEQRATQAEQRAEQLAAKLRALGVDPDALAE
jgi:hypothetical protein